MKFSKFSFRNTVPVIQQNTSVICNHLEALKIQIEHRKIISYMDPLFMLLQKLEKVIKTYKEQM